MKLENRKEIMEKISNNLNEKNELLDIRKSAFEKIENSPFPIQKYGLNIDLKNENLDLENLPDKIPNTKIETSGEGVIVNIDKTEEDINKFTNDFHGEKWDQNVELDKIYYFNQAFCNKILFIKIPKNSNLTEPVHINLELTDEITIANIYVLAEEGSNAQITLYKTGGAKYYGENIKILAEENSNINFISIVNTTKDTINYQKRKTITKKDASVETLDLNLGNTHTKVDSIAQLDNTNSSINTKLLFLSKGIQKMDFYTASVHKSSHASSDIFTRGVLLGDSKALTRGLVRIDPNAKQSNGYETHDALLLSKTAEADAIPNLEINNNEVKCSHGATIGQVDEEKIFYLMSRGLSLSEAQQKIVEGYFIPVLDNIKSEETKLELMDKIRESLATE